MCDTASGCGDRRQWGFVTWKLCIFVLIGFGLYSGCSFLPAYTTQRQLGAAVEGVLDQATHIATDDAVRRKVARAASSAEIELEEEAIRIHRERSDGERNVRIEFEYPVQISYLGSERQLRRTLRVSRTFAVDEAAEARRIAQAEENVRLMTEQNERSRASVEDYYRHWSEECANRSTADFQVTHFQVTREDGSYDLIDCDTVRHGLREVAGD